MIRRTTTGRPGSRARCAEVLEGRRLLSASCAPLDAHGNDHDHDDEHADGEVYFAPPILPSGAKASRIDPAGLPSSTFNLGDDTPLGDTFGETEPANNTPAGANAFVVTSTVNTINATSSPAGDLDHFSFTLSQRSGVFFDIDARETGLSNIDAELTLLSGVDGTTVIASNDDGDDFETFPLNDTSATARNFDSALYVDLNPGSYIIRVSNGSASTGAYQLKAYARTDYGSTIPVFNSLPGATDTLFLDFDGHSATDSWGTYTIAPYDWSGNAAEWTPGEKAAIENVWRVVAEDFAPFNVNVTTSFTGTITNAASHRQVIGNSTGSEVGHAGSLGVAFPNSYVSGNANNNVSFTFANSFSGYLGIGGTSAQIGAKAVEMGNTTSHEFGHALGLRHYGGTNPQNNGIMHTPDFGLSRERWKSGNTHDGETGGGGPQTDVTQISSATNTFGYRADDHGNSTAAATALNNVGNTSRAGIIEQKTDADFFRFSATGATTVSVTMLEHVANLDAELYLYDGAGTLLTASDLTTTIFASVTQTLPAGTYYAAVRSDGEEGEIGQYTLNVATSVPSAVPGTPDLLAVSDTGASGTDNATILNNASLSTALQFSVSGTVAGALVELLFNGAVIGSATATGTTTTITTDGTTSLGINTGVRQITARQTEPGKLVSVESAALPVLVDTADPRNGFDVIPPDVTTAGGTAYDIFIQFFDGNNGSGVDVSSLNTGDILVTGPGGFSQLATLVSLDTTTVPDQPIGTYRLTPPGGMWDFADNGTYTIATRADEFADVAGNFRDPWNMGTFDVAVSSDAVAPTIANVYVSGSSWTGNFLSFLQTTGVGDSTFGFRIDPAAEPDELPWVNFNTVSIRFSEHVNVAADDLVVHGVTNATYPTGNFSYDPATFTARWRFATTDGVPADKLALALDATAATGIKDAAGNPLAGNTTPRLHVLPGDVNRSGGTVNAGDVTQVRNRQFTDTANLGTAPNTYSVFHDLNGNAVINAQDVTLTRNRQFTSLPEGEPPMPELVELPQGTPARADDDGEIKRRLVDDLL